MVMTPKQKGRAAFSRAMISFRIVAMTLVFAFAFIVSCEEEKALLQSAREAEMEIKFGRNLAKDGKLVRNGIPVEINVIVYAKKFKDRNVTGLVAWEFDDASLDTVYFDRALQAFAYSYKGIARGRRKLNAKLENYHATIEFEVAPVELVELSVPGDTFSMGTNDPFARPGERPAHPVILRPFAIGRYEITNIEYFYFLKKMLAVDSMEYKGGNAVPVGYYSKINGQPCLDLSKSLLRKEVIESDIALEPIRKPQRREK